LYFFRSSLESGALMMTRRTWEGAAKCALRLFLLEEDTLGLNFTVFAAEKDGRVSGGYTGAGVMAWRGCAGTHSDLHVYTTPLSGMIDAPEPATQIQGGWPANPQGHPPF
jgi:hypothetical protein